MAVTQTYSAIPAQQRQFYELVLLEYAKKNLPHWYACQKGKSINLPTRSGDTVNFRRFTPFAAATTPLSEGVTPVGENLTVTSITATVEEYGSYVVYSDFFSKTAIDDVVTEISKLLGYQAGLTLDTLARNAMLASYTVQYAGNRTSRGAITSNDYMTADEIMKALTLLGEKDARPFDNGNFIAIISHRTWYDLMKDSTIMNTFLHATEDGKKNPLYTGLIGQWLNVEFYVTSNAYVYTGAGSSGVNVAVSLIIGKDAVGAGGLAGNVVSNVPFNQRDPLTGQDVRPITLKIHQPTPSASDPLGQRGSIGWITTAVAKVLNSDWIVGIEHANRLG